MTMIEIAGLPVAEKLRRMEPLWDALCAQSAQVSPAWHADVLAERLRRLEDGEEAVSDWDAAKESIRARAKTD